MSDKETELEKVRATLRQLYLDRTFAEGDSGAASHYFMKHYRRISDEIVYFEKREQELMRK